MTGDWRDDALCAEVGGDWWFPEKGGSSREAKRICMACDVRTACLDDALARNEIFGIRGGKAPQERAAMRRAAIRQPIGEAA
jgi:WhiB family redox-sensing transcriptional regulator